MTPDSDIATLSECPLCHGAGFGMVKRKFLGLVPYTRYVCLACGATFKKKSKECYALIDVSDKAGAIWSDYAHQSLTTREWITIGNGGMSDAKQHDADMEVYMTHLREGSVSISCINAASPILLKKNEQILVALPNISLKESRSVRTTRGSYGGPSFRVASGVYFRVGGFGSTSQSHGEIKNIDTGILTITSQRFIFSGGMKSIDVPLRKITGIDPFSDGIAIHREGYQKTQYFNWRGKLATLSFAVSGRQYQEEISGLVLKYLTEGAARLDANAKL